MTRRRSSARSLNLRNPQDRLQYQFDRMSEDAEEEAYIDKHFFPIEDSSDEYDIDDPEFWAYRSRNPSPWTEPKVAAKKIKEFLSSHYGLDAEVYLQSKYLERDSHRCSTAPITIISDYGEMIRVSLEDDMMDFCHSLGYWCEPYNDVELCVYASDGRRQKAFTNISKKHFSEKENDPATQYSYRRAIAILERVPVVGWDNGGMHQFTWIRMKNLIKTEAGSLKRETIIDSEPHRISDLEAAFEKIRELPGVQNIWYTLD